MLKKIISVITALFITITVTTACNADGWIDDWIQQKTVVSPQYFETQKRGYATIGNMSARWHTGVDHPITVTPPGFKTGCGGIDLFGGGIGFMQYDYLVKKLQRVMGPAAAAFAFDLALNTLCEPCANGIKSFTAIVDRLNQLQINDCKASKAAATMLVTTATKGWTAAKKSEAVTDFTQNTGISDLYNEVIKLGADKTTDQAAQDNSAGTMDNAMKDCPAAVKDIFLTDGSVLEHIASKRGIPVGYAKLMRGFIGDINVDAEHINFQYINSCSENSAEKIDAFVNGEMYERDPVDAGDCTKISSININGHQYTSIRNWAYTKLKEVADNMAGKAAMSAETSNFVNSITNPIYSGMKSYIAAMGSNADTAIAADTFADLAASTITYQMIIDFYDTINGAINTAQNVMKNSSGAKSGGSQYKCNLGLITGALTDLEDKRSKLRTYVATAQRSYANKIDSTLSNIQWNYYTAKMDNDINQSLTKHLGSNAASLMMR